MRLKEAGFTCCRWYELLSFETRHELNDCGVLVPVFCQEVVYASGALKGRALALTLRVCLEAVGIKRWLGGDLVQSGEGGCNQLFEGHLEGIHGLDYSPIEYADRSAFQFQHYAKRCSFPNPSPRFLESTLSENVRNTAPRRQLAADKASRL